ncbi:Lalv9 family protein [Pleurostoma richardsiae]|uniref:Lalv9 family protein n=1 Tax=Pleurostoma richardsiae TaxID=41990 RepID=A0AA38RQA5_9PEZI|nr:Lalv9 family protein [Pleurostoma richardsiae]
MAGTPTNGTFAGGAVSGAEPPKSPRKPGFIPLVTVVGFHHARGPEVETWFGVPEGSDPAVENDWPLLPFMALSDGAHASTEDFSYFTLLRPATGATPATSLFGISCTRQMDASQLLNRPADVTRSTVQKAVVVIADSPQSFGMLKERLSVVTQAWFAQREFSDVEILRRFQESLAEEKERGLLNEEEDRDQYLGMSLRQMVREFRWQTLVLLKCCLLQPKMLFFGSRCERLCMMQFSLISLIPGLIGNLQDCADPELDNYEKKLTRPTSLKTSDRNSMLSYMGLPLQIFGKGSLFGPYTPLQQLDVLADVGTKSYIVGSTNSLLLQQRDRYSDILINLDDETINITSPSLRTALQLSTPDRRWIDFVTQAVNDTWDETNPGRPKTMGYLGSEEFIRLQFEDYLVSLISSVKYHNFLVRHNYNPKVMLPQIEGDPSVDFGTEWVEAWSHTENYRIWRTHTDPDFFGLSDPRHPCAGGLTIDDVQRRLAQQVQDLHLDERFAQGKEVLGRNLAAGKEKASTIFNKLYADMEAMRETQRRRAEEARLRDQQQGLQQGGSPRPERNSHHGGVASAVDLAKAQQTVQSVSVKAGAYVSSWAAWAGEKRKNGWGRSSGASSTTTTTGGGGGGGWGLGVGRTRSSKRDSTGSSLTSPSEKEMRSPRMSTTTAASSAGESEKARPMTQESFGESIFDGMASDGGTASNPSSPAREKRASKASREGEGAAVGLGIEGVATAADADVTRTTGKEGTGGGASDRGRETGTERHSTTEP